MCCCGSELRIIAIIIREENISKCASRAYLTLIEANKGNSLEEKKKKNFLPFSKSI